MVDRQRRRHRRGATDGHATGRENRLFGRSGLAAFGFHRQRGRRRRIARVGSTAARSHLRRLDRPAVLQRVQLLCRSRQGDVRQQGGALLDDLRRRLCAQVRHQYEPAQARQAAAPRADRKRRGQARRHYRRSGPSNRTSRRRAGPHHPAVQPVRRQGSGSRLRAWPVGVQRLPRRSWVPAECRYRPTRPCPVLRHQGFAGRRRDIWGCDHQRARPGSR